MTTILLADDHSIVRQGLRALLEGESEFAIVGEAENGLQVPDMAERLQPDVLVLDLMMPGLNGLEVTRQVRKRSPQTRIVILSMYAGEAIVLEALRNGATGYVLKSATSVHLMKAMREVTAGRRYLSPPISERAVEDYAQKTKGAILDLYETLTTREREVLHLAAEGYSNPQIAGRLGLSARTVETHRANLMRKLDLLSQTDLVRYAIRRGIVMMEE